MRCAMISNRKAFLWVSSIHPTCQTPSPVRASLRINVTLFSQYARDNTLFLSTAATHPPGINWSYYAFSRGKVWGHDDNTIQHWYEIEMKKISATRDLLSLVDDPDATYH